MFMFPCKMSINKTIMYATWFAFKEKIYLLRNFLLTFILNECQFIHQCRFLKVCKGVNLVHLFVVYIFTNELLNGSFTVYIVTIVPITTKIF